ncbi:MAG TPA: hypothetical protein PKD53_11920 [Chloroflexaceae bacterium]|nr:hypothetical protein [Chloroflexaceae bacterium]
MQIVIIGDYEVVYSEGDDPALVIHHVVRGHDAVTLGAADAAELGALLAVRQKRIRELGGYRLLLGAGGDMSFYDQLGRRACYLTEEQGERLARLLAG